jgi:hypothetical protein
MERISRRKSTINLRKLESIVSGKQKQVAETNDRY